jgi:hypothetical protein
MHSRLEGRERPDRKLLSRTQWALRRITLLIAMTANILQAWMLSRMLADTDAVMSVFR